MTMWRRRRSLAAGSLVAVLLMLAGASARAAGVVTFKIELGGVLVAAAQSYQLETIVDKGGKIAYELKITRRLSTDTSWIDALQAGATFNPAVVRTLDGSFTVLNTYSLAKAVVTSVRHVGLASDPFITEEITLASPSLTVTAP